MTIEQTSASSDYIWQVSELVHASRTVLERQFSLLTLMGEVSGFIQARSGHWYFNLKDLDCQVRCVMFRNRNMYCQPPKNGDLVHFIAKASMYPQRGEFQLIGDSLTAAGEGQLQVAFQALKAKLAQDGLFDAERKRHLPDHCRRVAVVSSADGAAIHDFISVAGKRMPSLHIDLLPVAVQGAEAAAAACHAIALCNTMALHDVIVLTRGGGSLEDLWSFNDEALAHAIAASDIPVISAVGHETDFTIADFCADYRAPTPSAAAQAVTQDQSYLRHQFQSLSHRLQQTTTAKLTNLRLHTTRTHSRLISPIQRLQDISQRLDQLSIRLEQHSKSSVHARSTHLKKLEYRLWNASPNHAIALHRKTIDAAGYRSQRALQNHMATCKSKLAASISLINQLNPLQTLARGYSITQDKKGNIITKASQVSPHQALTLRLLEGDVAVTANADINAKGE